MRQLLVALAYRGLVLGLATLPCGEAGAQAPATVADLHDRWIDLLRDADGDIPAATFERVLGLGLLITTHGADGAVGHSLQVTHSDGASLLADVHTRPGGTSMSVSLEWSPGYFAALTRGSCIDLARLTEDLVAVGWTARPAAIFRRNGNLAAYGGAGESRSRRCRLYYQSHLLDPARTGQRPRVPPERPEG